MTATEEKRTAAGGEKRPYLCPKCKSKLSERVRRSFWVKTLLFWRPVKRFQCYNCNSKPYIFD